MPSDHDEIVSIQEAAELLGLEPAAFPNRLDSGGIRKSDIDLFLEKQRQEAEQWVDAQNLEHTQRQYIDDLREYARQTAALSLDVQNRVKLLEAAMDTLRAKGEAAYAESKRNTERIDALSEAVEALRNAQAETGKALENFANDYRQEFAKALEAVREEKREIRAELGSMTSGATPAISERMELQSVQLSQLAERAATKAEASELASLAAEVSGLRAKIETLASAGSTSLQPAEPVTSAMQMEMASIRGEIRDVLAKKLDPRVIERLSREVEALQNEVALLKGPKAASNGQSSHAEEHVPKEPAKFGVMREIEINYLMERMGFRRLDSFSPDEVAGSATLPMPDDAGIRAFLAQYELGCPVEECEFTSVVRDEWHMIQYQRVPRKAGKRIWPGRTK